jgi:hypothetical protein
VTRHQQYSKQLQDDYQRFCIDMWITREYREEHEVAPDQDASKLFEKVRPSMLRLQTGSQKDVPHSQMVGDLTRGNLGHIFTENEQVQEQ